MRRGSAAAANARKRRNDAAEKKKKLEKSGLRKAVGNKVSTLKQLFFRQDHEDGEPLGPGSPGMSPAKLRRKKEEEAERTPT